MKPFIVLLIIGESLSDPPRPRSLTPNHAVYAREFTLILLLLLPRGALITAVNRTWREHEGEAPVVSGGDVGAEPWNGDILDISQFEPDLPSSASTVSLAPPPPSPLGGEDEVKSPPRKKERQTTKSGGCRCKEGACKKCACAKAGRTCTAACHGGIENNRCTNRSHASLPHNMIIIKMPLHGHQLSNQGSYSLSVGVGFIYRATWRH